VIGVVPALWLDANWKPGTVGVAPTPPRGGAPTAGFIVEQGAAPMVIAHELGHTFGQVHTADVSASGYWPATRATQRGVDLMNSFVVPNPWLSRDVFQYLWSRLISTPGDPPVLLVRGVIHGNGTVDAGPWIRQDGLLDAPLDAAGSLTLEYRDAADGAGALLGSVGFDAATADTTFASAEAAAAAAKASPAAVGDRMFNVRVPDLLAGTRSLVLREGATVLLTRNVSAASPTVAFTAPLAGASYVAGQSITATIDAADADGGTLTHTYAISPDGGKTWRPLALDVTGASLTFTTADDQVGADVRLRVVTTDGVNTATADSASFTITAGAPAPDPRVVYVHDYGTGCGNVPDGCASYGLWTMNPDGTNQLPVLLSAGHGAAFGDPAWSRDGTQLAFATDFWRNPDMISVNGSAIGIAGANGSGFRALTPDSSQANPLDYYQYLCPSWSPDGARISFIASHMHNYVVDGWYIKTIAADGTDLRTVLKLQDNGLEAGWQGAWISGPGCPRWSPDGTKIAFVANRKWDGTTDKPPGCGPTARTPSTLTERP
jgi:hypothetical protein